MYDNPEILDEPLISENQNNTSVSRKGLIGKIRVNKVQNAKAVKDIISKAWAHCPGLHISDLGQNMSIFVFLRRESWLTFTKGLIGS